MAPKKLKECITFVMNIGIVRRGTQSSSQLLDKEKYILKHIIQKKIFLCPNDEVGVILMGSDSTTSDSIIEMENVHELCSMQVGNWDLIRSIERLQPTNQTSSWMEAIYAAVKYIQHECVVKSDRKIILLSTFDEDENVVDRFQAEDIAETLRSEEISLIAIGERALRTEDIDDIDEIDEDSQTASETLLMNVRKQIKGQYFTFEHAMSVMRFYKRPSTRPNPWRCEMELGDFRISIVGICKNSTEVTLPQRRQMAKTSMSDQEVQIKNVVQFSDNNRTPYTEEDIIDGYVYGGKAISVSDKSKEAMTLKDKTRKCYKIHYFTARENVPMEYWLSDGSYIIVPATEPASEPFYSLVQAMVDKNVVAIVEKVCKANSEANMMALFPSVDVLNEPWCLIEIGLPFERDYRAIAQRSLKFVMDQLSKEQDDAMDDLLESLELSDTVSQKYLPECMPDSGTQRMWDVLAYRALNPDQPLPPIAEEVLNIFEQPEVKEKSAPAIERIKNLFLLEKKKPLNRKRRYKSQEEDEQSDVNNDVSMTQTVKEEEKDTVNGNSDKSKNIDLSDASDFDFDDIADI